jgi:hypothetical protein
MAQVLLDESGRRGSLKVRYVDGFGRDLLSVFRVLADGREMEVPVAGTEFTLAYGRYRIHAEAAAVRAPDQFVEVRERFQIASVCFFLMPLQSDMDMTSLVRGRLSPGAVARGCTWLRVAHAFAPSLVQNVAASSKDGGFVVESMREGSYVFLATGPEGICEVATAGVLAGVRNGDLKLNWRPYP